MLKSTYLNENICKDQKTKTKKNIRILDIVCKDLKKNILWQKIKFLDITSKWINLTKFHISIDPPPCIMRSYHNNEKDPLIP